MAQNRTTTFSYLNALQSLLPEETKMGKQRLNSHMRMLAALRHHIRQQLQLGRQPEHLALSPLLSSFARQLQKTARDRPLFICAETIYTLPLRQCAALAVLMNELVDNAAKHGKGEITLQLRSMLHDLTPEVIPTLLCLEVSDEGNGFPAGFDLRTHAKLGLEIVEVLCRWDLQGELILQNPPGGGAKVMAYFPISSP